MGTEFVERMRGSKWNRALPGEFIDRTGGSKWVQAQPAGSKWQSALPTRNICAGKRFFIDSGKKSR